MGIATALREARKARGLTQGQLGRRVGYGANMVGMVENGERRLAPDVARSLVEFLDDPRFTAAVQLEASGGIGSPWLDGPRVDTHRSSVARKLIEELQEAIDAVWACEPLTNCRNAADLGEAGNAQIDHAARQVVQVKTACRTFLAVLCRDYGRSLREIHAEHRADLAAKGYIQGREVKRHAA
ncbi:MAG: XRE family transcriptional regulator [Bacillota bacterium]|jgi:transcriptional regulator with XRE-family HTH domain|nr:MAG: XRE family transcriptional regulator [Bacillota bacterium]